MNTNNILLFVKKSLIMDRMCLIASLDPEWYYQIANFVEENPEFRVLLPYASLTRYQIGFNKNPGENYNPDAPHNIFETLCYGICHAGVNYKYGMTQFKQLVGYLRRVELTKNMEFPFKVQPKKLQVYRDLINILLDRNIEPSTLTLEFVKNTKIKGIEPTKKQILEITQKWKNKKIGSMFIFQCFNYYNC